MPDPLESKDPFEGQRVVGEGQTCVQLHCIAPTTVQRLNWSVRGNVYRGSLSQRDGAQRHLLLMVLRQEGGGKEYNPRLMILIEHGTWSGVMW